MCNIDTIEDTLVEALPISIWEEGVKQAKRSTLRRFKTGAVVFHMKSGYIIGGGCSHIAEDNDINTTHAERHALRNTYGERNYGGNSKWGEYGILIVSLGRSGNFTYSSRPCLKCAKELDNDNIASVYWPERLNNGDWVVNCESPADLVFRAHANGVKINTYAKGMRI